MGMINNCPIAPNTNISSRGNTSSVFLLSNTWIACQGFEQAMEIATTKTFIVFVQELCGTAVPYYFNRLGFTDIEQRED
jgi:hypothetical protein